jgi:hypothetical protein
MKKPGRQSLEIACSLLCVCSLATFSTAQNANEETPATAQSVVPLENTPVVPPTVVEIPPVASAVEGQPNEAVANVPSESTGVQGEADEGSFEEDESDETPDSTTSQLERVETPAQEKEVRLEIASLTLDELLNELDEDTGYGSAWVSQVASAVQSLEAARLPNPEQAKLQVEQAASQLEAYLAPDRRENGQRWMDFLRWEEIQEQLATDKPNATQILQLALNMRQNYPGLEISYFVRLRKALENYNKALTYGRSPERSIKIFESKLLELAAVLQQRPEGSDLQRQRDIGLVLNYLKGAGQSESLSQSLRSAFSHANARVLVSSEFAQRQFSRPVDKAQPVRELILGTNITGTSQINGSVTPVLVQNNAAATVQLVLNANFSSDNVGLNRGVQIFSKGYSPVYAAETVQLTDIGLVSLGDTSVGSSLSTDINGIAHKCRLIRKIATKKVAEQKGEANSIAQGRLESRLGSQFHEELSGQLREANQKIAPPALPVLSRLGLPRPTRKTWTSNTFLALLWNEAGADQLMAPASCPLPVDGQGVTVQIHQSLLTNLLDPVLGGRIIRSEDLDNFATQFGDSVPVGIQEEADEKPWAISMAPFHPVEVELDAGEIKFILRTTKLENSGKSLSKPATITATYRIDLKDDTLQLNRQGDVDIEFAGKPDGSLRATTFRSFLKDKFNKVFKEQLLREPILLSEAWPADLPRLELSKIDIDDGWIQANLR